MSEKDKLEPNPLDLSRKNSVSGSSQLFDQDKYGLGPFLKNDDSSEQTERESENSNLSTFTEIAAKVNKFLPLAGYKNNELDWFELESKMREIISIYMKNLISSLEKTDRSLQQVKRTCDLNKNKIEKTNFEVTKNTKKIQWLEDNLKKIKELENGIKLVDGRAKSNVDTLLSNL
jgi:hypothetical protein